MDFQTIKNDYYSRIQLFWPIVKVREIKYSDIVLHLPVLEYYASLVDTVTEFGVRDGCSTVAFLSGAKNVISYDISKTSIVDKLKSIPLPAKWTFIQGDTSNPNLNVRPTDFLFFDTLHTYEHLKKELSLWGRLASRFIGFHDTFTCGVKDLSGPNPNAKGILPAIEEFINLHGDYKTVYRTDINNGLWILELCK